VSARLAPSMTADSQFFWDGVREHRLLIQRCTSCGVLRHPPRPMCPQCQSLEWDAIESSGRGTVFSFVIPHHPPLPWFPEPFVVALIDLEEGTRIVSNVVGIAPAAVTIGLPVVVRFEAFDGDVVLPLFAPEGAS
jgi:uncharacterized OB-fold protein